MQSSARPDSYISVGTWNVGDEADFLKVMQKEKIISESGNFSLRDSINEGRTADLRMRDIVSERFQPINDDQRTAPETLMEQLTEKKNTLVRRITDQSNKDILFLQEMGPNTENRYAEYLNMEKYDVVSRPGQNDAAVAFDKNKFELLDTYVMTEPRQRNHQGITFTAVDLKEKASDRIIRCLSAHLNTYDLSAARASIEESEGIAVFQTMLDYLEEMPRKAHVEIYGMDTNAPMDGAETVKFKPGRIKLLEDKNFVLDPNTKPTVYNLKCNVAAKVDHIAIKSAAGTRVKFEGNRDDEMLDIPLLVPFLNPSDHRMNTAMVIISDEPSAPKKRGMISKILEKL